ncbi:MAG: ribonuclease P protein component [Planctomycetota bacterium]|nr:ribonuclease P protein component [Planctomycetota bacterium]MCX8039429.1 ribonuclease P protein component [Planctomycetota bacterium]MDW8372590.1 ribonuclease P protein component [Planctomycetota bacterium]
MPDQRFPPAARFHHGSDFTRAFAQGQRAHGAFCQLCLRARGRLSDGRTRCARLGIMVSSKVARTAVRRHTLKRWVRELFRLRLKERLAGWDCVIVFRADPPDHAACDAEILTLLERLLGQQRERQRAAARFPRRH